MEEIVEKLNSKRITDATELIGKVALGMLDREDHHDFIEAYKTLDRLGKKYKRRIEK